MAISISSKGKKLKDDLEHGGVLGAAYLASFNDRQKTGLINAVAACIEALDVDTNKLHENNLTIAASLTTSSISITIS